ncbi:MAG: type II toxin-antitoxin system RelE/ParE family toxin [Gammaproteobacteria bacterium]|nr:type II toxin-antitoxin system RelE/ParE family toxin [Gammaproteobacteria bacterium]
MAQTLIWSHEALDDIDRIAEYISRDSLYHAQQVVERLFDLADELPAHPKLGSISNPPSQKIHHNKCPRQYCA